MSDIHDAIESLGRAQGVKALIDAHQRARRAVRSARQSAEARYGALAQAFGVAMRVSDEQKAAGVPLVERLAGIEQTLRAAWPFTREWKYLCGSCDDMGLVLSQCVGDATCGRTKPHLPHSFGTPCWCSKGAAFREKPKPTAEDFTAAGKSKLTRIGRWR